MVAMTTATTPSRSTPPVPENPDGPTSVTVPVTPRTIPSITISPGRRRVNCHVSSTTQIGSVATSSAATPLAIRSSAQTTNPFPNSISSRPMRAQLRNCRFVGSLIVP